jgi:hypothetical protein
MILEVLIIKTQKINFDPYPIFIKIPLKWLIVVNVKDKGSDVSGRKY